jgi:hypothetical protein
VAEDQHSALKRFLQSEKCWFEDWNPPADVLDKLQEVRRVLRSRFSFQDGAFVVHREAKFLREAWVLAQSCKLMGVSSIKLNGVDPPDGFLQRDGRTSAAEIVEVIEPGRKRNLEYGPASPDFMMDPGENWVRRAKAIPPALEHEIEKKRAKVYPASTELFVYLNIDEFGIRHNEIEQFIRDKLSGDAAPFLAIHVRWKLRVYSSSGETYVDPDIPSEPEFDDDSLWDAVINGEDSL